MRRTLAFHLSIDVCLFLYTFYFLFFLSHLPACVPEETCRLNDLAEDQHFEQQAMLGTWHMIARATPDVTTLYREFVIKYEFATHEKTRFHMNGKLNEFVFLFLYRVKYMTASGFWQAVS